MEEENRDEAVLEVEIYAYNALPKEIDNAMKGVRCFHDPF
jgi:hypothetical protein